MITKENNRVKQRRTGTGASPAGTGRHCQGMWPWLHQAWHRQGNEKPGKGNNAIPLARKIYYFKAGDQALAAVF